MSKKARKGKGRKRSATTSPTHKPWLWGIGVVGILIVGGIIVVSNWNGPSPISSPTETAPAGAANPTSAPPSPPVTEVMEVAKAVMVTVELDFGPKVPSIAEALQQVERRYAPDDGYGRTFAILDAYGEPTPDGKLHLSMHVSSEKPGQGSLVFRRTGKVLWSSRIVAGSGPPAGEKSLTIYLDNRAGRSFLVDGSNDPRSILDALVQNSHQSVREAWPDGAEWEATFVYSACGCPVKVLVRRVGERTIRTKDLPVIFPDDPAAVTVINRLMGWT